MNSGDKKYPYVYLKPGDFYFGETPAIVSTVLGSCVSITMYHPGIKVGAICHGLLPHCGHKKKCDGTCLEGFRYVDCSIKRMLKRFSASGIRKEELEVKIFGGSNMFRAEREGKGITVGSENVIIARNTLEAEGLKVKISDTGGFRGRKILFITDTGEVFLKHLHNAGTMTRKQGAED